jgi:O-antigen/teichoic acid export membrane protein
MSLEWSKHLPSFIKRRIGTNPQLQKILSNTGWMMGDKIARKAVGLLVGVLLARYLGPALFGEFSYAIAFAVIFSPIAMLGLDAIAIRRMIQEPGNRNELLGTSFVLMVGGGVIAFSMATVAIFVVRPEDSQAHGLVGLLAAACIAQAFIAIEFWFESQMQWRFTVYAKTSAFLLLSIVKIALVFLQAPLVAFAWAVLFETILSSAGLLYVHKLRGYTTKSWRFNLNLAGSMLRDSWPLICSALFTMIYLRIDQIMLGNMMGGKELGLYSVAVQIAEVWFFVPIALCSSVFPAIIEAEKFSEELFYTRLQRLYNLMAFISYAVAIPLSIFATDIIGILFSSAYAEAAPLLGMLVWAGLFNNLLTARNLLVVAKNWTRVNMVSIAFGCLTNIALNFLLIPRYGAMGAVVATLISYWFAAHGTCYLFKPLRKTGWMMTKAMIYPKFW